MTSRDATQAFKSIKWVLILIPEIGMPKTVIKPVISRNPTKSKIRVTMADLGPTQSFPMALSTTPVFGGGPSLIPELGLGDGVLQPDDPIQSVSDP